ncbi:hypothetical protein LVJ94_38580 [Pendulispora rubella]|uniref:Superoxide dismutase n=1 Tax=Pendulispora rubella TaxID=2741070 RepID=A0ABZ2KWE6_9BACT
MNYRLVAMAMCAMMGMACSAAADDIDPGTDVENRIDAENAPVDGAPWPANFSLPDGFQPEGIAIGRLPRAYFGSRKDGSIYQVNLRTGRGSILSVGPGTPSQGLKIDDRNRLFVAGGIAGNARVIDATTGKVLQSYSFDSSPTFVNDVLLTRDAAWFTDSYSPTLYKLPLGPNGALPAQAVPVPLTGDLVFAQGFNANGIVTSPDGRSLIVVATNVGKLYRVDPKTGVTRLIDVGGESLTFGDGLLREGHTLYVVRNRLVPAEVAVVELDDSASSGKVVGHLTDSRFDVPTTVASFGPRLYLPNGRLTTDPTPTTSYNVVAISKP